MDNQHRAIKGYRELDQASIDLMNEIKQKGEELRILINKIGEFNTERNVTARLEPTNADELMHYVTAEPERWLAMGRTDLQTGLMKLTRSVAKPGFF